MKIVVLAENTACREDLQAEHGLSLYMETGDHKILFDMGQSEAFAKNAQKLGVDLTRVDFAVLSHGHYDHGGGLETFLQINSHAPVYLHQEAFGEYYNGSEKYIGLSKSLTANPRLVFCRGSRKLAEGITLTDCGEAPWVFDSWGLLEKEGQTFMPDKFRHEQYLSIGEGEKQILISGCSHRGIDNIAACFQSDVLVGGFHLNKLTDEKELNRIADALLSCGGVYYTGHCTGQMQFDLLRQRMGCRLQSFSTGTVLEFT